MWQLQQGDTRQALILSQLKQINRTICDVSRQAKYAKMAVDSFVFYRGTAHLYYHDLHQQQVLAASEFCHDNAITWLQGDLHVENYGAFCDGRGEVIFDLNDFDESWLDSYHYDLYRLAVSILLVIERNDPTGDWDKAALLGVMSDAYLARLSHLHVNPDDKQSKITSERAKGRLAKFLTKAEAANSRQKMLDKWTLINKDERYFNLQLHKLEPVDDDIRRSVKKQIEAYHHRLLSPLKGQQDYFKVVDVAKRVHAGTGSLGTSRYYVLIDGHNQHQHDYRILDVKMQGLPSHFPYLPQHSLDRMAQLFDLQSQGCRVSAAQRAMHVHADDHLGSIFVGGQSYSVRERSPYKKTLDSAKLNSIKRFTKMAQQWGSILATAHARAERNFDAKLAETRFEQVMVQLTENKHAQFHRELFQFADGYTRQVNHDYRLFVQLLDEGKLA